MHPTSTDAGPKLLRLRGYQQECLDGIDKALQEHTRVAAVVPTGGGKTVIFAHLIERAHRDGRRALVMVHREELAEQAKAKIHSVAPHLTVGIVKAERNEIDADVIVASVQTLASPARREQIEGIGIVIVDECHHAVARTWMEVLAHFGCFAVDREIEHAEGAEVAPEWSDIRPTPAVGFTATLDRSDGKGLGDVWETVAFERDILYMIDNGYLTDVRGTAVTVDGLDLATVAKSRGDYQEGQLGEAMMASGAAEVVAQAYLEHALDTSPEAREKTPLGKMLPVKQGVLFAPTVASAYDFAEGLNAVGIKTATITGTMGKDERTDIYTRYEAGEIRVLSNVMVLTEGWDAPWCEVAVIARPTQSAALYTQMVGRVLRPWRDKNEALILDVVGVAGQHKLQSLTNLVLTEIRDGESYAEARVRIAKEIESQYGKNGAKQRQSGLVAAQNVELFANSHSCWLQTKKGTWFVPVTYGVFFLWPAATEEGDEPGTWRLGYKHSKRGGIRNSGWIEKNLTLEYAMAWGEQMSELDDPTVSLRDRKWRRTKASQAQQDLAIRLKIADPETVLEMRKGALSDAISIFVASRQLDI